MGTYTQLTLYTNIWGHIPGFMCIITIILSGDDYMPTSESQKKATQKYINDKLDEIKLRVPKGEKDVIKEHAASRGESANEFIKRAIRETMERDKSKK